MSVKRWIPKIAICLLLGFITTVAVAWMCAAWLRISHYEKYAEGVTIPSSDGWLVRAYRCPGAEYVSGLPLFEVLQGAAIMDWADDLLAPDEITWIDLYNEPQESVPGQHHVKVVNARGWPRIALWCEVVASPSWRSPKLSPKAEGGIPFSLNLPEWTSAIDEVGALPLRPIWSGLIIDTLFYGALWAVLIAIRAFLHRRAQFLSLRLGVISVVISLVLGVISTLCVVLACAIWVDEQYAESISVDFYGESRDGDGFSHWTVSVQTTRGGTCSVRTVSASDRGCCGRGAV